MNGAKTLILCVGAIVHTFFTLGCIACHVPDYKQIKMRAKRFEKLKRGKPDGVSWGRYLERLQEDAEELRSRRGELR